MLSFYLYAAAGFVNGIFCGSLMWSLVCMFVFHCLFYGSIFLPTVVKVIPGIVETYNTTVNSSYTHNSTLTQNGTITENISTTISNASCACKVLVDYIPSKLTFTLADPAIYAIAAIAACNLLYALDQTSPFARSVNAWLNDGKILTSLMTNLDACGAAYKKVSGPQTIVTKRRRQVVVDNPSNDSSTLVKFNTMAVRRSAVAIVCMVLFYLAIAPLEFISSEYWYGGLLSLLLVVPVSVAAWLICRVGPKNFDRFIFWSFTSGRDISGVMASVVGTFIAVATVIQWIFSVWISSVWGFWPIFSLCLLMLAITSFMVFAKACPCGSHSRGRPKMFRYPW